MKIKQFLYMTLVLFLFAQNVVADNFNPDQLPKLSKGYWCYYTWTAPQEREDGTILNIDEILEYKIQFEIDGGAQAPKKWLTSISNTSTHVVWWSPEPCPDCGTMMILAVDTDGRESRWARDVCPPESPVLCK